MVHILLGGIIGIAVLGRIVEKNTLKLSCIMLFLFAALRYMYGNDYSSYSVQHAIIRYGSSSTFDTEILFTMLNKITPSFQMLIILTSAAFVYSIYKLISKNVEKNYMWMSIFIFIINPYLFLMNLSAIRQCMAMILFFIAVEYAIKRSLSKYLIIIIMASLFHKSALLLLPIYFLATPKQVDKKRILAILIVLFVLLFVVDLTNISIWVAEIFNDENYMSYITSEMGNSLRATLLTGVFFVYVLGNLPKLEGKEIVYGKLYLLGLSLGILAFQLSMLTRIQMYFDIFSIIVIPMIMRKNYDKDILIIRYRSPGEAVWLILSRYVLPALIITIYFLRYYSFFSNSMWSSFAEYHTILSVL